MDINNIEIQPGESTSVEVNIARLPSRAPIDIIVTVARALEPGPVLLLMGGLHGDELNGIEIVRRIIERGLHVPERGTRYARNRRTAQQEDYASRQCR